MENLPDSVLKLKRFSNFKEILKSNKYLAFMKYSKKEPKEKKEYFDYFLELSKELPEIKFYVAGKRKNGDFDSATEISFSELKELHKEAKKSTFDIEQRERYELSICGRRPHTSMDDPRMFYLFKDGEKKSAIGTNKNSIRSLLYRLIGKSVPPLEGYIEKFDDYEAALKSNKVIAIRFQKEDSLAFDTVSKEPLFKETKFIKVDLFSEDSEKFAKEMKEKKLNVDWTYFIKDGKYLDQPANWNATKRKIGKKLCEILGKEMPGLPKNFIMTEEEREEIISKNKFVCETAFLNEEDSKEFEKYEKDYPEVKFIYTLCGDTEIGTFGSINLYGEESSGSTSTIVQFKKEGEYLDAVPNQSDEFAIRKAFSGLLSKPMPSFEGFPSTVEEIKDIISKNKEVIIISFGKIPITEYDKFVKTIAPEAKLIKVSFKECPGFADNYLKDKERRKKILFFKDGKEILRIDGPTKEEARDRKARMDYSAGSICTKRLIIKYLHKFVGKEAPKNDNPEEIDDLEEFKKIITSNKLVFAFFKPNEYDGDFLYKKISEERNIKDLKKIRFYAPNIPEFKGDPLVPKDLDKFVIYLDGKKSSEFDLDDYRALIPELYKQMGVDIRTGYYSEKEVEKMIKENEFVVVFQIYDFFEESLNKYYDEFKEDPKYSNVKFVKMDAQSFEDNYEGKISRINKAFHKDDDDEQQDECYLFRKGRLYRRAFPQGRAYGYLDYMIEGTSKGSIESSKILKEVIAKGGKTMIYFFYDLSELRRADRLYDLYPLGKTIETIKKECGEKMKYYFVDMNFFEDVADAYDFNNFPAILFLDGGKEKKRMEHPNLDELLKEAKNFAA